MATSFNLQEYILFRTEIKRELTNAEVDTNFKMVANPWEDDRTYEIGNIVYHPVIVDDPATTGEDQVLAWWRANVRTTQGVFNTAQWDMIGGIGSGNINIQGANGFGKINVNSTSAPGSLQSGNDALIQSTTPNDTFNFIAGQGMQLQYNLSSKTIKVINTLASNPGEVNVGENIGLGAGHQDVYSGKVGVNLQFYGFQSTNTGTGAALSISTNSGQKNIEYNFNEGLVDLAQLNSGAPLISMLSDVSTNAPNPNDILQWNNGAGLWTPIAIGSLGQVNLYTNDGSIAAANRTVSLNNSAGQLQFNRVGDTGTGIHFDNAATTHQLQLRNSSPTGNASQTYALNSVIQATSGIYGTDKSFGINIGTTGLGGLTVDALSISLNNELYVPNVATSSLQTTAVGYRIPLVNAAASSTTGRFESSSRYTLTSYTEQSGALDVRVRLRGEHILTGVSEQNTVLATSSNIISQHDFAANTSLTDGYGLRMTYNTPTVTEGVNIYQWMDRGAEIYYAQQLQTESTTGGFASKYIGNNISLDNKVGGTLALNVGQIIGFTGTGTNPQRVGLYSNVIDTQTDATSSTILTGLVADSGTWAGYFVGCVNIDKGGLVLPSTTFANRPLCNDVSGGTISDRTLWINSANGHLYRGTVDVEATGGGGGGSSTLAGLSDVTITDVQNDQLLVYNTSTGQWENAALAAYNLNAISLTSGGVSIALSDGVASSDVDLLPGTNITFSVNEATDEITINAANPPASVNIGNTDLTVEEPRTLDFYGSGTNNPLTFINTNGGTKNLFKFEQIGTGLTPQFTVGGGATNSEGQIVLAGNGSGRTGILIFNDEDGSNYTSFKAPNTLAQNINYVWPLAIGTTNQVLEIGSIAGTTATLKWTTVSGGGGGIGATGAQGAAGEIGASGAQGAAGGLGATGATGAIGPKNGLPWQSGVVGVTTPPSGKFYYDAATTSLYINKTDSLGLDQTTFLNTFDDTGQASTGFGAVILSANNNQQIVHGVITAVALVGNVYDFTITPLTYTANWGQGIDFVLEFTAYGTSFQGATGATGFNGATGFIGATGFNGATGATGATGQSGSAGATGSQGATGTQGEKGENGFAGATGSQGATGAIGLQGATGEKGENGFVGSTGFNGATGAIGLQGATGEKGENGFGGATGAIGNQGAIGLQGATGEGGVIGNQGATGGIGKQGAIGLQGSTGAQGATGSQGAAGGQGAIGLQGSTGTGGAIGNQGASGAAGPQGGTGTGFIGATGADGDYGGYVTVYNSSAVSTATPQQGKAVVSTPSWITSGGDISLSAQGTDPYSGGTTIDYEVSKTVYSSWKTSQAGVGTSGKVYFQIHEYESPQNVNYYHTTLTNVTVTSGLNGGIVLSKFIYIGGADIASFDKPIIGWSFAGSAGSSGFTGASGPQGPTGLTGATGSGGSGSGETLLWAGNRQHRAFIPEYGVGLYSFGQSIGASLPSSPGFSQTANAIVLSGSGNLNTYNMNAGYRVNQNFGLGDTITIRGVLWFNRTALTTVTNLSALQTTASYINVNGTWDPANSTRQLTPFPGTTNTATHQVQTGANGSTCIFEHEMVCDAALQMTVGDLIYFGWSVQNIGGESNYFNQPCSMTYQVYKSN